MAKRLVSATNVSNSDRMKIFHSLYSSSRLASFSKFKGLSSLKSIVSPDGHG